MDVKTSYNGKKVGIAASGKKKYAWFAVSESMWEELQYKLDSNTNWIYTFENGSTLKFNGNTCLFTGINGRQKVFKIQCDKWTMFGVLRTAKLYSR
jgi:hypothetical protein